MRTFVALLFIFAFHASALSGEREMTDPVWTPAGSHATLTTAEKRWLTQEMGTIRVGITVIPPQVIRTSNGYEGLAIDYVRLVEQKLGCHFAFVPFATWNEVIQAAKDRRIDMIFAAQQTPERLGYLLFSEPYIELPNMIVVRRDRRGGRDLKEMKGWTVAVSAGSAVHEYLKEAYPQINLRPVSDELGGLMSVSLGEADAMVVEISRASYYIQKAGIVNLRVAGDAGLLYRLRFAVRKDLPMLRGILDKGLASITPKERKEISRRWIIVEPATFFATKAFRIWFSAIVGTVVLGIMAVMIWNRTLRNQVRQRTRQLQDELAERKRAEVKILETNERFRSVLRAATAYAIIGTDQDGIIRVFNVGAELMLGYGAEEVVDRETPLLFHDQDEVAARGAELRMVPGFEVFAAAARKGETEARQWTYIRKDGSRIDVSLTVTAMRDEAGELTGFIGVAQDITERKRNEEMLLRQATELEQEVAERQRTQEELQVLNSELEERVRERTAELESKYEEVARLNKVFVGRELRMVELKNELRALRATQVEQTTGEKP